jgi:rsbT co-antagonist protein RsbR
MRCEGTCLLETDAADQLPLSEWLTRLRRCDACPHTQPGGGEALVPGLLVRLREAGHELRRAAANVRKLEAEARDITRELDRYEQQITKLERMQQVSSEQIEAALAEQVARVREQEREIEALAVPIIHVWTGVIVLPIIGVLTSARAHVLTERLLAEVAEHRAHTPIIDLTGVGDIDTSTADHLVRMIASLRLLGARPILTGITPDVARMLVELGARLPDVLVLRNVRQALRSIGLGDRD